MNMAFRPRHAHGSGMGGKSGGGGSKEDANSLLSNATALLIDFVSQGPIKGLVAAEKSIFFDGVPMENLDGTKNFQGITWESRIGEEKQPANKLIAGTESEQAVNIEVTTANGPVTQTIQEENIDAFRARVRIPSLMKVKDNGDIVSHTVTYAIKWAPQGSGSFQHIPGSPFTLTGKNNSPYYRDHEFDPPTAGPWDVRMERVSPDETSSKNASDTWFDAIVGILRQKMIYPWSAYFAWKVEAEQFGSSIPTRTYEIFGRIIRVPSNYDPETRTYSGLWDGTFKLAWTDNPAWVLFDLLTNSRYGARLPDSKVDIAALYTIAKYCDGFVPNGFGGMRPRYTVNVCINTQTDGYSLINNILSNFRAMLYWQGGQFSFSQDAPATETAVLVTPANTENGFFSYTTSTDKSRANIVYVQYNNPKNQDKPDFEIVTYNRDVVKRGPKIVRVTAWGCRDQSQARQHGEWLLYTLHNDTAKISYVAGLDHEKVKPGQIVAVADPLKSSTRMSSGRLAGFGANQAILDRKLKLNPLQEYQIALTDIDGNVIYRDLQTFATGATSVTFNEAIDPAKFNKHSVWIIYHKETGTRKFRVTNVQEKGGKRIVSALLHNPSKFGYIERDQPLTPPPVDPFVGGDIQPPRYFTYTPISIEQPGTSNRVDCLVSWTYPEAERRVTGFQLEFADDSENPVWRTVYQGRETSFTMENILGAETLKGFRIKTLGPNPAQDFSPYITLQNIELFSRAVQPLAPTVLNVVAMSYGKGIRVSWAPFTPPSDFWYVEVWRSMTNDLNQASIVGNSTEEYFVDNELTPGQQYYYWLRTRVRTDNASVQYSGYLGPQFAAALPPPMTDVLDDSITAIKIRDGAVTAEKLMDEAVTAIKLADQAVSEAKLQVGAVTAQILAAGAVDISKFADGIQPISVVPTGQPIPTTKSTDTISYNGDLYTWNGTEYIKPETGVADGSVTAIKLADAAVTAAKLANQAVTHDKLVANSIYGDVIAAGAITARELTLTDFTNIYPDPDFRSPSFYSSPDGGVITFAGTSSAGMGTRYLGLNNVTADVTARSEAFPIQHSAEYYVDVAYGISTGSGTGTVEAFIELYSVAASGVMTLTRSVSLGQKVNTVWTNKSTISLVTTASEKRAVLVFKRYAGGATIGLMSAPTLRLKNNANLIVDGSIIASKLAVGSVTADAIAANSVIAAKIAAGAITTEKLAVGVGTNWLTNSDFSAGTQGWGPEYINAPAPGIATIAMRTDTYGVQPYGSLELRYSGSDVNAVVGVWPRLPDNNTRSFPVVPGQWLELSGRFLGHRCKSFQAWIRWGDKEGNLLGYDNYVSLPAGQNTDPLKALSNYNTFFAKFQVPAGAVQAIPFWRNGGPFAGQTDAYLWLKNLFFGPATVNQTEATPWSDGGLTLIGSGNLTTGSVIADSIGALAVTAAKIAAGAITAEKIQAGAVTADKIAANTITGDKLVGNSITARELLITDFTNLIQNWDFADASAATMNAVWSFTQGTYLGTSNPTNVQSYWMWTTGAETNSNQLVLDRPNFAAANAATDLFMTTQSAIPVTAGETLAWEIQCRTNAGAATAGLYYRLLWYTETGAAASPAQTDVISNGPIPAQYGVARSGKVVVPTGARFCRVRIYHYRTNALTQYCIIDRISLRRANAGSLIVDGSIVAGHLAANSVTASSIAAGAITAASLGVTNLAAIVADLGAITAGSINIANNFIVSNTGQATIRSATSGARMQITNNRIDVYDAGNVLRVRIGQL